ncbi:glycine oxidase ThiO [Streptomyces sp. NPDC005438]|uniref:glycine oxidase ThiO n=1 Tax=Streptomyces sp. NPDC005438 TaxID=3156880 RepID=UPI0033A653CF
MPGETPPLPEPPTRTADVAVVGGGVIGLVTAWRAAQRGLRAVVLDPEPGRGAARVAAGMLAPVTEVTYGEEPLLALNLAAVERYPDFVRELAELTGRDVGYRDTGTLAVALDADDRAQLGELHAFQRRLGLEAEWLTGRECRRLEPMLAPSVRGGLRAAGDLQLDPRRLCRALLDVAVTAGVTFHPSAARRVRVEDSRAREVTAEDGTVLAAEQLVLAAGAFSGRLEGVPPEVLPPVRPVKGQVLRLWVPPEARPFLSRTVRAVVRGGSVYLVPRADGELVVGATSEEQGFDTTVTAGAVYELLRDARELVPGVTELPLRETNAGLRPGTPDNGPLLGRTTLPGLLLATGHHRNGVLLTPLTGEVMTEVLTGGELPEVARPFDARRFSAHRPTTPSEATP